MGFSFDVDIDSPDRVFCQRFLFDGVKLRPNRLRTQRVAKLGHDENVELNLVDALASAIVGEG